MIKKTCISLPSVVNNKHATFNIVSQGKYYPDNKAATSSEPALHVKIRASHYDMLKKACQMIKEMLEKEIIIDEMYMDIGKNKNIEENVELVKELESTGLSA